MNSSEKFCLRWNDFETNISVAFREIREEKDFFDCTLSCGSRQIQAHKLILSACSPFFRSILRQNPHQHPLLYLKGVEFTDLQAVLNFMYHGEVNVAQEELNTFLSVAEDLQVKGLTQNESSQSKPNPEPMTRPRPPREPQEPAKRARPPVPTSTSIPPSYQDDQDDIQEVLPVVKSEPESTPITYSIPAHPQEPLYPKQSTPVKYQTPPPPAPLPAAPIGELVQSIDDSYEYGDGEDGYDYGGYEGDGGYEGAPDQMEADTSKGDASRYVEKLDIKSFRCGLCAKSFTDRSNCTRHVKINHLGEVREADMKQPCPFCGKFLVKRTIPHHVRTRCPKAPADPSQMTFENY
eukprot:GFUD01034579.1.p1 GENE.GFUD01034579.1~~GFUD01034579.1.p1  ORF type:complete len:350 (-),score=93.34 GFUD01034579.1:186-1235(-)